jgi:hypothetical protein
MISPPIAPVPYAVTYVALYDLWNGNQLDAGIPLASRLFV